MVLHPLKLVVHCNRFERNDIDINEFDTLFSKEADKKGFQISGKQVVKLLSGDIRKPMVDFLLFLKENYVFFKINFMSNNLRFRTIKIILISTFSNHKLFVSKIKFDAIVKLI